MTDNIGYGKQKRRDGNLRALAGEQTFRYLCLCQDMELNSDLSARDSFREMLDSVVANGHTFDECKELLKKCMFIDVFLRDGVLEI